MSIVINNLRYVYNEGTPFESVAIDDVSLEIKDGDFVGLIGHTGSGKSTLIQHLNGLIKPTGGSIIINGMDITQKGVSLVDVRKKVGLVFQYPEYQLFEETIFKDIAFGPEKLGLSESEVEERVIEAMNMVGLDPEKSRDKSPFELSGGQKRRVAIAGVIAMKPEVLILDEPTASMDLESTLMAEKLIDEYRLRANCAVILITHSLSQCSRLADEVLFFHSGRLAEWGEKSKLFAAPKSAELKRYLEFCNNRG